ncbi:hypothetical protein LXL04_029839 [Taraxacum kok-saghyz]
MAEVRVVRERSSAVAETDDGCGWNRLPANAPPAPLFIAATHPSRCNLLLHSGLAASRPCWVNWGLVEAAKDVLPRVEHRQCASHVFANYKKAYNGLDYKRLFWAASFSTTEAGFILAMVELKAININAYNYLVQRGPSTCSRAFFPDGMACEVVENGVSESFNSVIMEARTKPILTLLEELRIYVIERFCRMSTKHITWNQDVCPAIIRKLKERCVGMRLWSVIASETQCEN